jgi:hypothetical protein
MDNTAFCSGGPIIVRCTKMAAGLLDWSVNEWLLRPTSALFKGVYQTATTPVPAAAATFSGPKINRWPGDGEAERDEARS